MGTNLCTSARASSFTARAFEPEQPACLNLVVGSAESSCALSFPPHKSSTLLIIVAAALVDNCCESIDEAKVAKLLDLRFGAESPAPIGHTPASFTTGSNLGFKAIIDFAIW